MSPCMSTYISKIEILIASLIYIFLAYFIDQSKLDSYLNIMFQIMKTFFNSYKGTKLDLDYYR